MRARRWVGTSLAPYAGAGRASGTPIRVSSQRSAPGSRSRRCTDSDICALRSVRDNKRGGLPAGIYATFGNLTDAQCHPIAVNSVPDGQACAALRPCYPRSVFASVALDVTIAGVEQVACEVLIQRGDYPTVLPATVAELSALHRIRARPRASSRHGCGMPARCCDNPVVEVSCWRSRPRATSARAVPPRPCVKTRSCRRRASDHRAGDTVAFSALSASARRKIDAGLERRFVAPGAAD